MLNPIDLAFKKAKNENRPALLTYTVAGDSTKNQSLIILNAISKHADILELGFPPNRLASAGYGEFYPISEGENESDLQQNRRIELKLTSR